LLYNFWANYDLEDFYNEFRDDKYISKIIDIHKGLRPMHDPYPEMFVRAILTQNSSVEQIRKMQTLVMKTYGKCIRVGMDEFYTWPEPEILARINPNDLKRKCKVGYRAEYLVNTAKLIVNKKISLDELKKLDTRVARELLTQIKGIGPKVGDMILFYSLGKVDAFPMDVWIRRALMREYFGGEKDF
jgi:N-glycosylase/DNA lyase